MNAKRFNRICLIVGLAWLMAVPFGSLYFRTSTPQDFPQYYMAGVVAAHRAWENLYPVPTADGRYNLGFEEASTIRPGYRVLAAEVGTSDQDVRFIQAPTVALMSVPLSWLRFKTANDFWRVVLALCVWISAIYAVRIGTICFGQETKIVGIVALACCVSPLAFRVIRVGNVSAIVAVCIAVAVFDLLSRVRPDKRRGFSPRLIAAIAIVFGFFLKYVTVVLVPVELLARQWKTPLLAAVIGAVALSASYSYIGPAAFHDFATQVAPTLVRSHPKQANQSLQGWLLRITHRDTLSDAQRHGIFAAQFILLAAIATIMLRVPRERWHNPALLCAGAFAPIVWLLIFGPLYWEHYPAYFIPFAGWLAWEATQSRGRMIAVLAGAAMLYVPFVVFGERLKLFEPISSHMLWGTLLLFVVAIGRLLDHTRDDVAGTAS